MAFSGLIRFVLGGDSKPLEEAGKRGEKALSDLRGEFREGISSAAKWTAAMISAGTALTIHQINKSRQAIDVQAKLALSFQETFRTMAIVERASENAGVAFDKVTNAAKNLDLMIGRASQGEERAIETLNRLHLSAKDLADLPLDERIRVVNDAIRENIPQVQQAAVAADVWGAKLGHALMLLSGNQITQATEQTKLFGTALSEIDVAKVEAANDAVGTMAEGLQGFWMQMSVQSAPVLQALGEEFIELTEEAGGMGAVAERNFEKIINGAGFAADAVRGLHVVFLGVDTAIAKAATGAVQLYGTIAKGWVELGNLIPGVDVDYDQTWIGRFETEAEAGLSAIEKQFRDLVNAPLPSEGILQFWEDAKNRANEAAAAAVRAKGATGGGEGGVDPNTVNDIGGAWEELKNEVAAKVEIIRQGTLSEQEVLKENYIQQRKMIEDANMMGIGTAEENAALLEQIAFQHQQRMTALEGEAAARRKAIQQSEAAAKMAIWQGALSDMSTLMNTESRKLFEVGKAAAIANAIVSTYQGAAAALKLGWPMGMIAAAAITAKGFAQVSAIRSQQFGGGGAGASAAGSNTAAVNAASTPVNPDGGGTGRNLSVTLVGNDQSVFSMNQMRAFVGQLQETLGDGYNVKLNNR